MSIFTVYDDFQGFHGANVLSVAKEKYSDPIFTIDNAQGNLDWNKLMEAIKSESTKGTKVFNCSFGAGQATQNNQTISFLQSHFEYAFNKGMVIVFSGGNSPNGKANAAATTTSPYTIDAGGGEVLNGKVIVSNYSQYHPSFIEYHINGFAHGVGATSYAAPRLSSVIANLNKKYGKLSQSEIRSALTQSCVFFQYNGMCLRYIDPNEVMNFNFVKGVNAKLRIQALYRLFMQRHPDVGGYEYWLNEHLKGKTIQEIAVPFKNSKEYRENKQPLVPVMELAQSMYHLWLNREADDQGCAYWANEIIKSNNFVAVANRFIEGARYNGEKIDERLLF